MGINLKADEMKAIEMQISTENLDLEQRLMLGYTKEEVKEGIDSLKLLNQMLSYMQNPPKPPTTLRKVICGAFEIPEDVLFKKSRKREIVNARQTYIYLVMTTDIINKSVLKAEWGKDYRRTADPGMEKRDMTSVVARHIGLDHATMYHSCRVTQNYYDTEDFYRDLIKRLRTGLFEGKIEMPDVCIPAE